MVATAQMKAARPARARWYHDLASAVESAFQADMQFRRPLEFQMARVESSVRDRQLASAAGPAPAPRSDGGNHGGCTGMFPQVE